MFGCLVTMLPSNAAARPIERDRQPDVRVVGEWHFNVELNPTA